MQLHTTKTLKTPATPTKTAYNPVKAAAAAAGGGATGVKGSGGRQAAKWKAEHTEFGRQRERAGKTASRSDAQKTLRTKNISYV
jgi:hypothetical protein